MRRSGLFDAVAICSLLLIVPESDAQPARGDTLASVAHPILTRPTDTSITISIVPKDSVQVYYECGTVPLVYSQRSETTMAAANVSSVLVLRNLSPNTRYYYRMRYRELKAVQFQMGQEYTFCTQRSRGSAFTFTVEADPHPYDKKGSHTLWGIALQNQLSDRADFLLDLGDTFGDDHNPFTITSDELRQLHLDCLPFFGTVCHSSPLFLCLGNHEGESGYYLLQSPPNNLAVNGTLWRKFYYANPQPDGFYSGNTVTEGFGIGLPENYYAWEWGDALFVVLDAYRGYTVSAKPRGWEWTLGRDQYDWFKRTLERSNARFKFVFAHHTLGETRGGVATANLYEWGGYEADGRTWGFAMNRQGWPTPIHQLMVENGVNIYFQGHDHLFAVEELDGVVYQEVPMPSDSTYIIGVRDNGASYSGAKVDGSGHVRVTVAADSVRVDYVQAWLPGDQDSTRRNGKVAYSYAVRPTVVSSEPELRRPAKAALEQNYPNPFNPETVIQYQLPIRGFVTIRVFDILGSEVALLLSQHMEAGAHSVSWNASQVPSGVYFYRLQMDGFVETRKAVVLR